MAPPAERRRQAESPLRSIIRQQTQDWAKGDVEAIVSAFAERCEFIIPKVRLTTPGELRQSVESYFSRHGDVRVKVSRIVVEGDSAAVEWSWSERDLASGKVSRAEDAIVLRVQRGKIVYWREYIDSASCFSTACQEAAGGSAG